MTQSVGNFLINHNIPEAYKIHGDSSAKDIKGKLEDWARADPTSYSQNVPGIKRTADNVTTGEGLSMGLDDLEPLIKERKPFLKKYQDRFDATDNEQKRKEIVSDAIKEGAALTLKHCTGSLSDMVNTGAKGNASQLMKNIMSPISAREPDNTPYPYLINKSFAEGLTPGQYWVASIEARNATVEGKLATAEPGDLGKQMFNMLNTMVVTTKDCGTTNGLYMKTDDNNILDRYLAKDISGIAIRNTLVTGDIAALIKKKGLVDVMVRSPMTCEARNGICQMCYGLNASGRHHDIGANVGTIAAQAISEPLTQMKLSTKHGVILSGKSDDTTGMKGVKKLLSKPKIFPHKSTLAQIDGVIKSINKAPQGGHYIFVNDMEHYVPVESEVVVTVGEKVIAGDALSDGLKDPREFSMLRGLGSGRSYFIQAMYNAYNPMDPKTDKRTGLPMDKRHLEVLAKKDFNHVIINEHNDTFAMHDIVEYNQLKDYMAKSTAEVDLKDAMGEYLGKEYIHYMVGTEVTPNVMDTLKKRGFNKIIITKRKISFSPHITSIKQVPLLKENFLGKMSHHELKDTLVEAARYGQHSDLSSYDPVPAFVQGITFGEGAEGRY